MKHLKIPVPIKSYPGVVRLIEFYIYVKFNRAATIVYATLDLKEAEDYLSKVVDKKVKVRNSYYIKLDSRWCKVSRSYDKEVSKALHSYEENKDQDLLAKLQGEDCAKEN